MIHRRKRIIREIANVAPRKILVALACEPMADCYIATDRNGAVYKISGQEVLDVS